MTQPKKKTAFVPCKSFKHDGATLTVGVAEVTVNRQPNPSEALLGFARVAHKQDGRV